MNQREYLRDLADLALHLAQFDQRCGGETRQQRILFIEYCEAAVRSRINSGRSSDCDEYRALLKFAGKS